MDILQATKSYERWMRERNTIVESRQVGIVLKDLRRKKSNWLASAAKQMAKAISSEWHDYKKS
jgi:recombinational DNA repair ATPase RecF